MLLLRFFLQVLVTRVHKESHREYQDVLKKGDKLLLSDGENKFFNNHKALFDAKYSPENAGGESAHWRKLKMFFPCI